MDIWRALFVPNEGQRDRETDRPRERERVELSNVFPISRLALTAEIPAHNKSMSVLSQIGPAA